MTIAQALAAKLSGEPRFLTLKDAFEQGGLDLFAVRGVYQVGDALGEAETVAEVASEPIPCDACGRSVRNWPKVGWASLMMEDRDEQPTLIRRGIRLCQPCAEKAREEDRALGDHPPLPYIVYLALADTSGSPDPEWVYAQGYLGIPEFE